MLFIGCHLHAHHSNTAERNAAYWRAERGLSLYPHDFEYETERVCDRFDRVFWMGDMNYRINGLRHMVDKLIATNMHEVRSVRGRCVPVYAEGVAAPAQVLWFNDQLRLAMERAEVFHGFVEGPLFFKPTYKFDKCGPPPHEGGGAAAHAAMLRRAGSATRTTRRS